MFFFSQVFTNLVLILPKQQGRGQGWPVYLKSSFSLPDEFCSPLSWQRWFSLFLRWLKDLQEKDGCKVMQAEEYVKGETHSKSPQWTQRLESTDASPETPTEGAPVITAEPHPVGTWNIWIWESFCCWYLYSVKCIHFQKCFITNPFPELLKNHFPIYLLHLCCQKASLKPVNGNTFHWLLGILLSC